MLLWLEEHMANKIVIPLQSLISCFLNPLGTGKQQWVQLDSGRGYLVVVAQVGGGSSVLNLLCAKDKANENCEHRSGIQQIFCQVIKGIPWHIFPTAFSSCPSAPLSIYATAYKVLGTASSFHF